MLGSALGARALALGDAARAAAAARKKKKTRSGSEIQKSERNEELALRIPCVHLSGRGEKLKERGQPEDLPPSGHYILSSRPVMACRSVSGAAGLREPGRTPDWISAHRVGSLRRNLAGHSHSLAPTGRSIHRPVSGG